MTMRDKLKIKFGAIIILFLLTALLSYPKMVSGVPPLYNTLNKLKINLGLDLQGGIHLEYTADVSQIESAKIGDAMQAVQDSVEKKVNAFGVAEPIIYSTRAGSEQRLVVELAGIKDINEAKKQIGEMPFLEFKEEGEGEIIEKQVRSSHILINKVITVEGFNPEEIKKQDKEARERAEDILKRAQAGEDFAQLAKDNSEDAGSKEQGGDLGFVSEKTFVPEFDQVLFEGNLKDGQVNPELVESQFGWHIIKKIAEMEQPQMIYISTDLTGKNLDNAMVDFQGQSLGTPQVAIQFDSDGSKLFAELTKKNLGKTIAIVLNGKIVSAPRVQAEIANGKAVITGNFTTDEAKDLVRKLNEGALPVPLVGPIYQESVGAFLGEVSLQKSLKAGIIGLILVIVFMLAYYRFLGLVASVALIIYACMMIAIFKLSSLSPWQITLTLPGIAGFILSVGMAVDANILIFERTKEEIRRGRNIMSAIEEGFKRAWTSIFDGNVSSIITALILINLGTGFVKGFAVTLIIGVLLSLFTAITITRTILRFSMGEWIEKRLWLIGVKKEDIKK